MQFLALLKLAAHSFVPSNCKCNEHLPFFTFEMDTPKPVQDLLDSLSAYEELVQPKEGSTPVVIEILKYDRPTQPHTEMSYVPDLTQGEFQPLEDIDDELLQKLDLETIVAAAEESMKNISTQQYEQHTPKIFNAKDDPVSDSGLLAESSSATAFNHHVPPLLKLHKPKPVPAKIVPPHSAHHFLPPVSDSAVDDN